MVHKELNKPETVRRALALRFDGNATEMARATGVRRQTLAEILKRTTCYMQDRTWDRLAPHCRGLEVHDTWIPERACSCARCSTLSDKALGVAARFDRLDISSRDVVVTVMAAYEAKREPANCVQSSAS